jgi:hypothetical protein
LDAQSISSKPRLLPGGLDEMFAEAVAEMFAGTMLACESTFVLSSFFYFMQSHVAYLRTAGYDPVRYGRRNL